MNRADQAPEPTMEEILASIRLIISDDAKKGPSEMTEQPRRPAPPEAASLSTLPEEDVLDLTDELVFPEARPEPAASPSAPAPASSPAKPASAHEEPPLEAQPDEDAVATYPQPPAAPEPRQAAAPQPAPAEPRVEPSRPAQAGSRTIWSRRELPGAPPVPASAPRYEPPPARQPQRNWAQDIQMPVPEHGPVSLIPGQTQSHADEPKEADHSAGVEAESEALEPNALGEKEEAAVAALAESLARSAAGGMDAEELAKAGDLDFARIDDERKAEVTETFANAMQRAGASRDKRPLPTLLDEVFRQDFIRGSEALQEPAQELLQPAASFSEQDDGPVKEPPHFKWRHDPAPMPRRQERQAAREEDVSSPRPAAAQEKSGATMPVQVSEPAPASAGRTLEDAVRDMLRPILVQWLNENMPRILESAIRDEIATRGVFPKSEK